MTVADMIKKSLAFGLGAAVFSAEKMKQFADDMVARGEMSTDEASSFVDEMSEKAEEQKRSIQAWVSEQVAKMLDQAGAAQASRVEHLEARVAMLERRLGEVDIACEMPDDDEASTSD